MSVEVVSEIILPRYLAYYLYVQISNKDLFNVKLGFDSCSSSFWFVFYASTLVIATLYF